MKVPNVRIIAICDEAVPSATEAEVFSLENVRFYAVAESFPHSRTIHVYLLLFFDRPGNFSGTVVLSRNHDRRVIRYARVTVSFDTSWEYVAARVEMGGCVFPEPGYYSLEVKFMDDDLVEHPRADSQIILLREEDQE